MTLASDFMQQASGRKPSRVTRYISGAGTHAFHAGARWCRVTVIGGGGKGGDTGKWFDGANYHYEAGGGGGGGETRVVEFDPSYLGSAPYAVGAAQSASTFACIVAAAGANGLTGAYEGGGTYRYEGGLGGGLQRLGDNDDDAERPTVARNSYSHPGSSGGGSTSGVGGNATHGIGGAAGAHVAAAYPAPCNNGSPGSGHGAGGGGGSSAATGADGRTLGVGANGTGGLIVVEEWVY